MYCNVFFSLGIFQVFAIIQIMGHKCVFFNNSLNSSGCDLKNHARCRKATCSKDKEGCVSVYKNMSGTLRPLLMGCMDTVNYDNCGVNTCPLTFHNGHYTCCCHANMCNTNVTLPVPKITTLSPRTTQMHMKNRKNNDRMLLVYILAPIFSLLFLFTVLAHVLKKHKDSVRQENHHLLERDTPLPIIYRAIQTLDIIHEGQFAKVFRAKHLLEIVVVKEVLPAHDDLWCNEKDIYEKWNIRHENILNFIGAEKRQYDNVIQYWIITEYCSNGSLTDYLRKYTLNLLEMLQMTVCILKGLDYLHSSNPSSVTIAHRDLKSSNILVKSNLTCCISDFGLSISLPFGEGGRRKSLDMSQVGTRRYMAPEVLRGAITFNHESFIAVDMYAFALVAWELVFRTSLPNHSPDPHELPYNKEVGNNPTLDSMIKCVVEENKRPELYSIWRADPVLNVVCETIEECWDVDAYARVAAKLVYLRLSRLSAQASSDENMSTSSSGAEVKFLESSDSTIGEVPTDQIV